MDKMDQRMDQMEQSMDKMNHRMDALEFRQRHLSKKMDDLQLDVKISEREIRRDIHGLNDEMDTVIELMKIHRIIQL